MKKNKVENYSKIKSSKVFRIENIDSGYTPAPKKPYGSIKNYLKTCNISEEDKAKKRQQKADKSAHENKMRERAVRKLEKANTEVTPETISKELSEAKKRRVESKKKSNKKSNKRKQKREEIRASKIRNEVIRIKRKTKIKAKKIALYTRINNRKKIATEFLRKANEDVAIARKNLIQSLAEQKYEIAKAEQISLDANRPVKCGDYPLYLKNCPLAPRYTPSEDLSFISFIYVLIDPNDNTVRYVGKTKDVEKRFKEHHKFSVYNKNLWQWKKSIKFKFRLEIVAVVDYKDWEAAEISWIAYYRNIGKIYNISKGGKRR